MVDGAIQVWERLIIDFHNQNNTYSVAITGGAFGGIDLGPGGEGQSGPSQFDGNGIPVSGSIQMDADGGGLGWYVDPNPADNAEYPAVRTPFHLAGGPNLADFRSVVLH